MRTRLRRTRLRKYSSKAPLKRHLDALCRALVFARDGHRCVRCGATQHLQWAHVYSRRFLATRWLGLNSMTLCAGDHLWWHHRPVDSALWWRDMVGERAADLLRATLNSRGRVDLHAIEQRLRMGVL